MKIIVETPAEGRQVVSGVIAVNAENPRYGSIMLSQTGFSMGDGGFVNKERRVAFIAGETEQLKEYTEALSLTPGCDFSVKTGSPKKLVIKESTTPFFAGQAPKINPSNGQLLSTKDGEPIYRRVSVVAENSADAEDVFVAHHVAVTAAVEATAAVNVASVVE